MTYCYTGRSRSYKKGIDANEGRRNRNDTQVQLRKNKREEGLQKRRAMAAAANADATADATETSMTAIVNATGTTVPTTKKVWNASDIPGLVTIFQNPNATNEDILRSITGFRKMLSVDHKPPVQEVINANVLPKFVQLMTHSDEKIQFEACWALTNVASTEYTRAVVEHGAIKILVQMLLSGNPDVREQSAWCLGNIAGDATDLRDLVLEAGAMESVLKNIANPASDSLLSNTVWALSNLCRGKPQPPLEAVQHAIPYLTHLVNNNHENKNYIIDACWALSYVSDGEDSRIESVMSSGVTSALCQLLSNPSSSFVTPALRTLGNFVSGNDTQTERVLDADVLTHVRTLLQHPKRNIRKEACWLLSNIAAGNHNQINRLVCEHDIISAVIGHMESAEWEVKKEATWVLCNLATGGSDGHIHAIVELGGINALCSIIDYADPKILLVVLDALEGVLRVGRNTGRDYLGFVDECDGLDKIEKLQEHENHAVYKKAVFLIEQFFGVEEECEDENIVPTVNGDTFAFGLPGAVDGKDMDDMKDGITPTSSSQNQQQGTPLQPFNFSF